MDSSGCARPGLHYGPAGPGLSRVPLRRRQPAAATDGTRSRGRVGPSAAARYRTHPRAGLRALGPRPGFDRDRAGCIFTPRCGGALHTARADGHGVQTRPLSRSGSGCSPFGRALTARFSPDSPAPRDRVWRPGTGVIGPVGRRHSGTAALPAGRPLKLGRRVARCRACGLAPPSFRVRERVRSHGLLAVARRSWPFARHAVPRCGLVRGRPGP